MRLKERIADKDELQFCVWFSFGIGLYLMIPLLCVLSSRRVLAIIIVIKIDGTLWSLQSI